MPLLDAQTLCCDDCGPDSLCPPPDPGCDDCNCPVIVLVFEHDGGGIPIDFIVDDPFGGAPEAFTLDPGDPPEAVVFAMVEDGIYSISWTENGAPFSESVVVFCDPPEFSPFGSGEIGCQEGAILGSGDDLRVLLVARGGTKILAEINPDSGHFDRRIDDTSELTLTATVGGGLDASCCEALSETYQWATEVLVYRDGRDAWVGPVTDIDFEYGRVVIRASDLSGWWDRRVLSTQIHTSTDLTDIFVDYHDDALDSDPSPNIVISETPTGIFGTREVDGSQYDYARDHLDELARTGVDWTAYSRTIIVGPQEIPIAPYVTLLDEHFVIPPRIEARGNDQATVVVVKGRGVTGIARDEDFVEFYGELVRVFDEPDIDDQASVNEAAQSRLDYLKDPIFVVSPGESVLRNTAPITVPELIPGIRMRLDSQATCRQLVRDFRLQKVTVRFNGEVAIELQPLGTVDVSTIDARSSQAIG